MFDILRHTSYYKKTILSFLTVLLIPTLVMGGIFYYSFIRIMDTEVNRSSSDLLKQITDSMNGRIEELDELCVLIQNDPFVSMLRHPEVYADITIAFKHLSSLSMSNAFISDYYVYLKDVPNVLSSSITLHKDRFFDLLGIPGLETEENFLRNMNTFGRSKILGPRDVSQLLVSTGERYFIYIVPLPYNDALKSGAMIFFISESTIRKNISSALNSSDGQILLFDSENNLLEYYGDPIVQPSHSDIVKNTKRFPFPREVSIGGNRYIVSSTDFRSTGWTITSIIPKDRITHKVNTVRNTALLFFLLTMLAGIIISYYLTRFNYKPIKELTDSASKYVGRSVQKENDLQTVRSALDHMDQTINHLHQKIKATTPALKRDLIIDFLKGRYYSLEELNEVAKEIGMYFNGKMFSVAAFHVQDLKSKSSADIIHATEGELGNIFSVYGTEIPLENIIVFILAALPEATAYADEAFRNVRARIKTCFETDVTIGIGEWHLETKDAGISYLQALTAIDYRFVRGKNTVIFFQEIRPEKQWQKNDPNRHLEPLVYNIVQGNVENVHGILDDIIHEIKASNLPLLLTKTFCYSIINQLDASLEKVRKGYKAQMPQYLDIFSLSAYESIDDIAERLKDFSRKVCIQLGSVSTIEDKQLIDKCLDYIEQNYADPDFSLNSMAESFCLSLSNLSHYFKSRTNESVSEYVRRLRVEKARELLLKADGTNLQQIALQVGFDNVARFIRSFKQVTGITPGAYRDVIVKTR